MIDGIKQVGVVGAGAMGAGVRAILRRRRLSGAAAGHRRGGPHPGQGRDQEELWLEPKARDAALQRIAPTTRIDDFADCDVVVEAVLERFDVKKAVMENLDGVCRPETIRATNTSSISVTRIARSPPEDIGNVCSRRKAVRLSKHRRRMARNEALLVGRDDPHGDR